jgi:hypothetical protein
MKLEEFGILVFLYRSPSLRGLGGVVFLPLLGVSYRFGYQCDQRESSEYNESEIVF